MDPELNMLVERIILETLNFNTLIMKKLKLFMMSALVISGSMLSSCGGDEAEKKGVTFDGEKMELPYVGIDMGDYAAGNYEIAFLATAPSGSVWDAIPHVIIQIGSEWDGETVDLTVVDDQFDWSWYVEYESADNYLWGFGCCVEEFNDVTGGSFKITELDAETMNFEITGNIEFGEQTLKVYYKGELEQYNVSVPARTESKGNK